MYEYMIQGRVYSVYSTITFEPDPPNILTDGRPNRRDTVMMRKVTDGDSDYIATICAGEIRDRYELPLFSA